MAKARAIVKRRKAVRNIRKITKTMQMIATAKFQKSLKRVLGSKPYTMKIRELVAELAASVGNVSHPLLRRPDATDRVGRIALLVMTSNRGLCGAYNGSVLRSTIQFLRKQDAAGATVDLYVSGKKGVTYFTYTKRAITQRYDQFGDAPKFAAVEEVAQLLMDRFVRGEIDAVYVSYMNFISTGVQRAEVATLLPLAGVRESVDRLAQELAEREAQMAAGSLDAKRTGSDVQIAKVEIDRETTYDFMPDPASLLEELLPQTVKTALYQAFLDASTSEHVSRMIAMKAATENAAEMIKALTMEYNRARQSQITTELSEIMGGVEAMK